MFAENLLNKNKKICHFFFDFTTLLLTEYRFLQEICKKIAGKLIFSLFSMRRLKMSAFNNQIQTIAENFQV